MNNIVSPVEIDHSKVKYPTMIYYIDKETYQRIENAYRNLMEQYNQLINKIIHEKDLESKIYFWDILRNNAKDLFKVFEELRK